MEWRVVNPQEMIAIHRFPAPQFFGPGSIHGGPGAQTLIRTRMGSNDLIPVSLQPQVMTLQPGGQFTPTSIGTIIRLDGSMHHVVSTADGGQMVQLGMLMNRPPLMSVGPHLASHHHPMMQPAMQSIGTIPLPPRAMIYLNPSESRNLPPMPNPSNPSPVSNLLLHPHSVRQISSGSPPEMGDPRSRHGQPVAQATQRIPPAPLSQPTFATKPKSHWSISPVEMSESEEEEEADNLSEADNEEPVTIYRNDSAADFAANVSSKQWHGAGGSSSVKSGGVYGVSDRKLTPYIKAEEKDIRTVDVRKRHATDSSLSDNSENDDDNDERREQIIEDLSVSYILPPLPDSFKPDVERQSNNHSLPMVASTTAPVSSLPITLRQLFTSAGIIVPALPVESSVEKTRRVEYSQLPASSAVSVQYPTSLVNAFVSQGEILDDSESPFQGSVPVYESNNVCAAERKTHAEMQSCDGTVKTKKVSAQSDILLYSSFLYRFSYADGYKTSLIKLNMAIMAQ